MTPTWHIVGGASFAPLGLAPGGENLRRGSIARYPRYNARGRRFHPARSAAAAARALRSQDDACTGARNRDLFA